MSAPDVQRGSCLCGAVRYAVSGPIGPLGHCHCTTCRKAHGAVFSTTARVARSDFRWEAGDELLRAFESSPGKRRTFCSACGSQLVAARDGEDEVILRLGCLDTDPGSRPLAHIWMSECAPWYDPADELPRFERGVTRGTSPNGTRTRR